MLAGPLAAEDGVGVTGTVHDIEHGSGTKLSSITGGLETLVGWALTAGRKELSGRAAGAGRGALTGAGLRQLKPPEKSSSSKEARLSKSSLRSG